MAKYIFILIFILSVFLSCSEDSGNNSVDPTFSSIYSEVISLRCAKSGCHNGNHPRLNMQTKQNAYSELLNKTSSVGGLKYVEPEMPNSSYLYLKIIQDGSGRQGARMPRDGETNGYLSTDQIAAIRDWIQNGAKDN